MLSQGERPLAQFIDSCAHTEGFAHDRGRHEVDIDIDYYGREFGGAAVLPHKEFEEFGFAEVEEGHIAVVVDVAEGVVVAEACLYVDGVGKGCHRKIILGGRTTVRPYCGVGDYFVNAECRMQNSELNGGPVTVGFGAERGFVVQK